MISRLQSIVSSPESILSFLVSIILIIFALSIHEWAHAFVAHICGDDTAKLSGRMTLNPLHHLDPIGTFSMILLGFGYAKPVPINPNNFKKRSFGIVATSLAGVTANIASAFIVSILCGLLIRFIPITISSNALNIIVMVIMSFVSISCSLAVFNLLPIPPLDGYQAISELIFRGRRSDITLTFEKYGRYILLALLFSGIISSVLSPIVSSLSSLAYRVLFSIAF